jgi:hypothetical protein
MRASSGAWRARHRWRSTPARGQVPPTLRARCPAVPTASYHRLSVSTATVSVSMVAGRILAAWRSWRATVDEDGHYSFAVPLGCRSPPCAPIGRFATPCDLARRLAGGRPAGIATWSAYPSIAAAPINPKIDVMGQQETDAPQQRAYHSSLSTHAMTKAPTVMTSRDFVFVSCSKGTQSKSEPQNRAPTDCVGAR